jgi:hypothetical protein
LCDFNGLDCLLGTNGTTGAQRFLAALSNRASSMLALPETPRLPALPSPRLRFSGTHADRGSNAFSGRPMNAIHHASRRCPKPTRRRALELLDGATEAILLAGHRDADSALI